MRVNENSYSRIFYAVRIFECNLFHIMIVDGKSVFKEDVMGGKLLEL